MFNLNFIVFQQGIQDVIQFAIAMLHRNRAEQQYQAAQGTYQQGHKNDYQLVEPLVEENSMS